MTYFATYTPAGLHLQVEGPEVEVIFAGPVAGGPVDFETPPNGSSLHDAVVARFVRYCEENLLPVPTAAQVVLLTNVS